MEIKRNKKIENVLFAILVIIGVIIGMRHRKEMSDFREKLITNAAYSIGEVTYYLSGKSTMIGKFFNNTGRDAEVEYHFIVGTNDYKNRYSSYFGEVPNDGVAVGERYLVLYNKDSLEQNRMYFKNPIKDSTDFKRYVQEFEKIRKKKK